MLCAHFKQAWQKGAEEVLQVPRRSSRIYRCMRKQLRPIGKRTRLRLIAALAIWIGHHRAPVLYASVHCTSFLSAYPVHCRTGAGCLGLCRSTREKKSAQGRAALSSAAITDRVISIRLGQLHNASGGRGRTSFAGNLQNKAPST